MGQMEKALSPRPEAVMGLVRVPNYLPRGGSGPYRRADQTDDLGRSAARAARAAVSPVSRIRLLISTQK